MAKLYFYYGAMGSSKTANALMVHYNYTERGQKALLAKTNIDTRDGNRIMRSRIGLEKECILLSEVCAMKDEDLKQYNAVIVDEIHGFPDLINTEIAGSCPEASDLSAEVYGVGTE